MNGHHSSVRKAGTSTEPGLQTVWHFFEYSVGVIKALMQTGFDLINILINESGALFFTQAFR